MRINEEIKAAFEKRAQRINTDGAMPENSYYAAVSRLYYDIRLILFVVLILTVILSLLINSSDITYDNMYYLFRDFNSVIDTTENNYNSLSYATDFKRSYHEYKGGLAVVGSSEVLIFTSSGRQTLSYRIKYANPQAICSDKYLLVYDLGGTEFTLFNSFSAVYSEKTDYPISNAALSDGGMFAVVTETVNYKSDVRLYNEKFNLKSEYLSDKYTSSVAINADGSRIAIVSFDTENGVYTSEIALFDIGSETPASKTQVNDAFPIDCSFFGDNLGVILMNQIILFSKDGKQLSKNEFGAYNTARYDFDKNGCALILSDGKINSQKELIVFDKDGKSVYNKAMDYIPKEKAIALYENEVFIHTDERIICYNISNGHERFSAVSDGTVMTVCGKDSILACSDTRAKYIVFEK